MKSRNVKVAYAIAVVLITAAAIVAVLTLSAARTSQYNDVLNPPCPAQQRICAGVGVLPSYNYSSYVHDVAVAAVISAAATGGLLLLALVRRRMLFPATSAFGFSVTTATLVGGAVNIVSPSTHLAGWVLVALTIGVVILLAATLLSLATGDATKRQAISACLLTILVEFGAALPLLLARFAFAAY